MVETLLLVSALIILLALLLAAIRFLLGPTTVDRVVAFDGLTIVSLGLIALVSHFSSRGIYIDVAIVYAFLSFLGVIAFARYLEGGL